MRILIASLLPTLWLVNSAQGFLVPVADCATFGFCSFAAFFENGAEGASKHPGSFFLAARPHNLRLGLKSGPDKDPLLQTIHPSRWLKPAFRSLSSSPPEIPLLLARGWQFVLRTALEPRAPSLVS